VAPSCVSYASSRDVSGEGFRHSLTHSQQPFYYLNILTKYLNLIQIKDNGNSYLQFTYIIKFGLNHNGSVVGIVASLNNLYDSLEDGHQIGRNMLR
jgi:hypothetical protein